MTIRGSNGYFGRAKFKTYLRSLPPNKIVGRRRVYNACPLANFLAELIPEARPRSILVTSGRIEYIVERILHLHETPYWAFDFINAIDGKHPDNAVTAAEALAALD